MRRWKDLEICPGGKILISLSGYVGCFPVERSWDRSVEKSIETFWWKNLATISSVTGQSLDRVLLVVFLRKTSHRP